MMTQLGALSQRLSKFGGLARWLENGFDEVRGCGASTVTALSGGTRGEGKRGPVPGRGKAPEGGDTARNGFGAPAGAEGASC